MNPTLTITIERLREALTEAYAGALADEVTKGFYDVETTTQRIIAEIEEEQKHEHV